MKKKIALLLTVTSMVASLLGGCGGNSQTVTTSGSTNKKVDTLSEYLSKEKTICYEVSSMDKEKTPMNAYFFEDGKMTIIPGDVLGLTLGELAKMEDKDIWEVYAQARTTYAEDYSAQLEEQRQTDIKNLKDTIDRLKKDYGADADNVETDVSGYGSLTGKEVRENLDILNGFTCKGPFYDIPFSFTIKTDSSGNIVENQQLVYPSYYEKNSIHLPTKYYSALEFDNTVEGGETQIYNTTYNCFPVSGNDVFCTRDSMTLDTVNSKNVLIDPNDDKLNKLYAEEVTSIFE